MIKLSGKRVLFIAPKFFGYELEIIQELQARGALVDYLQDRPFNKPIQAALTKIFPSLIQPWINRIYRQKIGAKPHGCYDLIFVINGQTLDTAILLDIKAANPSAKTVLYMWDSVANRPRTIKTLPYYDKSLTFDSDDARKFGLTLRPLFYVPGFARPTKEEFEFEVSFIGTMHSDRYRVIQAVQKEMTGHKGFWYLYLQAKWVYWVYWMTKPFMRASKVAEFKFQPIAKSDLQNVFAESKAVVDIEHPKQRGLTMRTLETLGSHKKLITTNQYVKLYDFYDEQNICVIDRNTPQIPLEFLETPYKELPFNLYQRYSLGGWLDEVMANLFD